VSPQRPYSPWRRAGDFVILSGQLGVLPDQETMTFVEGGSAAQVRQALENAKRLLGEAGATLGDVVKASLFVLDMEGLPPRARGLAGVL